MTFRIRNPAVVDSAVAAILVRDIRHPFGGVETWVRLLADGLPGRKIAVFVLAVGGLAATADLNPAVSSQRTIVPVPLEDDPIRQARQLLVAIEELSMTGLRGVFFSQYYPSVNITALNLPESCVSVPVIHGRDPGAVPWVFARPPQAIVAPAHDLAVEFRRHYRRATDLLRSAGKVWLIPHGVEITDNTSVLPSEQRPYERLEIAVASRLEDDKKRPQDIIAVARNLQELKVPFRMRIAGEGSAEHAMRRAAAEAGLKDTVVFCGRLGANALRQMFRSCDLLLSTSESEAFGLSMAEAASEYCAIVACAQSGFTAELSRAGAAVTFPVADPARAAECIRVLHSDRGRLRTCRLAAGTHIRRYHTANHMLDRYARLIRSIRFHSSGGAAPGIPRRFYDSPQQLTEDRAMNRPGWQRHLSALRNCLPR